MKRKKKGKGETDILAQVSVKNRLKYLFEENIKIIIQEDEVAFVKETTSCPTQL